VPINIKAVNTTHDSRYHAIAVESEASAHPSLGFDYVRYKGEPEKAVESKCGGVESVTFSPFQDSGKYLGHSSVGKYPRPGSPWKGAGVPFGGFC